VHLNTIKLRSLNWDRVVYPLQHGTVFWVPH